MGTKSSVAWVTGGSSGIGYAIAEDLADAGYTVVISARNETALQQSCNSIKARGGTADYVVVDVASRAEVDAACQRILDKYGHIDVLANSAGFNVPMRQWHELKSEEFESVLAGNLTGTFNAIHAVLPTMRECGTGVIVNIASMAAKAVTIGGGVAYTVAKGGVVTLTESVNRAEFKNGIRACVVAPGEVATPAMARRASPPPPEVLDRMLKPEDVANAVRFAVQMPPRACVYEIDISPTWNRGWL